MTHMHIPDGVLPVWLWLLGFVLMSILLGVCITRNRSADMRKKVPLLGALSAAMLVGMSLPTELILPGYHINLSVMTGILIGPSLGFIAAFISNLVLAFMGHGGITVIGLNTLLLGSEAVLGHFIFTLLKIFPVFWRAAVATVLSLLVTTSLLIGFVALSHLDPSQLHHDHDEPTAAEPVGQSAVTPFAVIVLTIGPIGWIVEAIITGAVAKLISQIKPDLLQHALHRDTDGKKGRSSS